MHPLNSVKGAITTGVVIAIIISIWLTASGGMSLSIHWGHLDRWLHIVAGVTWIGLLYYFNVVQTPGLAAAAADSGAVMVPLVRGRHLGVGSDLPAGRVRERERSRPSLCAAAGIPDLGRRCMARHHHVVQRVGLHLAEPKENPRDRAGDG